MDSEVSRGAQLGSPSSEFGTNSWPLDAEHPRWYKRWEWVISFWVFYTSYATPVIACMVPHPHVGLGVWEAAVSAFFIIDVAVTYYVAPDSAARKRYTKGGLSLDIISSYPWVLTLALAKDSFGGGDVVHALIELLPMLRLYRLPSIFKQLSRLEKTTFTAYFGTRIVKLLAIILWGVHWSACLMFFLSYYEATHGTAVEGTIFGSQKADFMEQDVSKKWIQAFYWAALTGTSIGGDATPVTIPERLYVSVYAMYSMVLLAFSIGSVSVLLVKEANATGKHHEKVRSLYDMAATMGLPKRLVKLLKGHLRMELQLAKAQPSILDNFPRQLRNEVTRTLFPPILEQTVLFKNCSKRFIDQVVGEMKLEPFMPDTVVLAAGEVSGYLYVVMSGVLVREAAPGEQCKPLAELGPGSVFGKVAVLCNYTQLFTVKTKTMCELLRLDRVTLSDIVKAYPRDGQQMLTNLKLAIPGGRGSEVESASGMVSEIRDLLTQREAEQAVKVCNAAARGDLERLRDLLHHMAIPDVAALADQKKRTPLHLVAARGFKDCLDLLIEYGADVNALDGHGVSPLAEAVSAGHMECVQALRAVGARLDLPNVGASLGAAVSSGNMELLTRLLSCGANVDAVDHSGRTPLHMAVIKGNLPAVRVLVQANASLHATDRLGRTPVEIARANKDRAFLSSLEAS